MLMTTDETRVLRRVMSELRAIRLRVDRQIAVIQKVLRPAVSTARTEARSTQRKSGKPATKGKQTAKSRRRPVGYARDRQTLSARLARKNQS